MSNYMGKLCTHVNAFSEAEGMQFSYLWLQ